MTVDIVEEDLYAELDLGDVLCGNSCNYHIEGILGEGGFGKVVKCRESTSNDYVAVKIVRGDRFEDGQLEAEMMEKIGKLDPEKHNLLALREHFVHKKHFCLVYELLDVSLYDLMTSRHFQPLGLNEIRVMGQQLLVALRALKHNHLLHSDIKPDNIMLVNQESRPFKVKLIDFGLTTQTSRMWIEGVRQTLPYSSPEALLHLPSLDEGVDMWALGCLLAFLYLGGDLYPYECEYEVMRMILQLNGQPDNEVLDNALDTDCFFDLEQDVPERMWSLKSPEDYTEETGEEVVEHRGASSHFGSLDALLMKQPRKNIPVIHQDTLAFISLLKQMLAANPRDRITPSEALRHSFFTLRHFPAESQHWYVLEAKERMTVCQPEEEKDFSSEHEGETSRTSESHGIRDQSFAPAAGLNAESKQDICENVVFLNTAAEADFSAEIILSAPRSGTENQQGEPEMQPSGTVVHEVKTGKKCLSGIRKFFRKLLKTFRIQRNKV